MRRFAKRTPVPGYFIGMSVVAGLVLLSAGACNRGADSSKAHQHGTAANYSCPMHPEVTQAGPGKCPKCGMALKQGASAGDHGHADHGESSAQAHADHSPKHGGLFGMQGDHHVELVVRPGGAIEVYLYDAYTKPLALEGVQADVRLEMQATEKSPAREISVPLARNGEAMTGQSPEAEQAHSATVNVKLSDASFSMTFPLQVSVRERWLNIAAQQAQLEAAIQAGELAKVHVLAFAIRDHVVALEAKTETSNPAEREKIIDEIYATAGKLDEFGDGGNASAVKEEYRKFQQQLQTLRALSGEP